MARTTPKTGRYRSTESKRLDWNNKRLFSGLSDERLAQMDARIAKYKAFIDEHEGDEEYRQRIEPTSVTMYRTDNVPVSRYALDLVKKRGT